MCTVHSKHIFFILYGTWYALQHMQSVIIVAITIAQFNEM